MSKRATDLGERMRATTLKEKPKAELGAVPEIAAEEAQRFVDGGVEEIGKPNVRPKSVGTSRYTIDLEQNQRKALKQFALNIDADASEVVRALLAMLQETEDVKEQVKGRIQAARSGAVMQ